MAIVPRPVRGRFEDVLFDFIAASEGFVPRIYSDHRGIPTLGLGYAILVNTPGWPPRDSLDRDLASIGVTLTSADRARDFPHHPVYLLGVGEGHIHEHISQAHSLTTSAAKQAGERAYAMAGLSPRDMDFAQLYDCFTPTVLVELEDLGFCAKGEGGPFAASGALRPGGALPVNTHGGLLSHSHPGNPGSMFALTESIWATAPASARSPTPR